jgi:hypothetical protein
MAPTRGDEMKSGDPGCAGPLMVRSADLEDWSGADPSGRVL